MTEMLRARRAFFVHVRFGLIALKKSADLAPVLRLPDRLERAIHSQPAHLSGDGHHRLELCQFPEVLGCGCEGKFVLNAAWTA